jgi:GNAT superfamily N-acetyltransferase
MSIESFKETEYGILGELFEGVYPEYPGVAEDLRHTDATRMPPLKAARWLLKDASRALGMVEYSQSATRYDPRRFTIDLLVRPDAEGRGLGKQLYAHLLGQLEEFDPLALEIGVREDKMRGLRFAGERGFAETMRSWESRLDPRGFNPEAYDGLVARVTGEGIVLRDLTELAIDPERERLIYELRNAIIPDVPSTAAVTEESYEQYLERFWKNPLMIQEACFIALDGERYVGYSQFFDTPDRSLLYTGLTGVRREYRGRGIATALKVRAIAWAKAAGRTEIVTWNASQNVEMLGINAKLGFVRQKAWIDFEKVLGAESGAEANAGAGK